MEKIITACPDISLLASIGLPASELEDNLLAHRTDICISSHIIKSPHISDYLIMKEPLLLVVSDKNPLSKREVVRVKDIENECFLSSVNYSIINKNFEIVFVKHQPVPETFTISNVNECLEYISLNRCISILTHTIYDDLLRRQTPGTKAVMLHDDDGNPFYFEQYLYYRKKNNNNKVIEVKNILLDYFNNYIA